MASSVDATRTKSLATSRSISPMRSTSARYWSATSATLMAPMSTFWRLTSDSSRSKGPENEPVCTRNDTYRPPPQSMTS